MGMMESSVARKLSSMRLAALFFAFNVSALAYAGVDDCHLDVVDMISHAAVARCGDQTQLISQSVLFRGYSARDMTPQYISFVNDSGEVLLNGDGAEELVPDK